MSKNGHYQCAHSLKNTGKSTLFQCLPIDVVIRRYSLGQLFCFHDEESICEVFSHGGIDTVTLADVTRTFKNVR